MEHTRLHPQYKPSALNASPHMISTADKMPLSYGRTTQAQTGDCRTNKHKEDKEMTEIITIYVRPCCECCCGNPTHPDVPWRYLLHFYHRAEVPCNATAQTTSSLILSSLILPKEKPMGHADTQVSCRQTPLTFKCEGWSAAILGLSTNVEKKAQDAAAYAYRP